MTDTATIAAFVASERACYEWPEDTETAKAQRAAFCAGAAWAASANGAKLATRCRLALTSEETEHN